MNTSDGQKGVDIIWLWIEYIYIMYVLHIYIIGSTCANVYLYIYI